MLRSLVSLLFILCGIPLIAASLHGDSTIIETADARLHGLYAGIAFVVAGFVLGKFWVLNLYGKKATATVKQEPEQIDLFEPRNQA